MRLQLIEEHRVIQKHVARSGKFFDSDNVHEARSKIRPLISDPRKSDAVDYARSAKNFRIRGQYFRTVSSVEICPPRRNKLSLIPV